MKVVKKAKQVELELPQNKKNIVFIYIILYMPDL